MPSVPKPVQPPFGTIPVSTKTVIARTNARYDIQSLFRQLPIAPYEQLPKRRGRKPQGPVVDPNADLPSGSIVTLKYFEQMRGVDLKRRKNGNQSKKYFRNALSVVMKIGGKFVNFKLSKNGKFQMTGIKTDEHAVQCVQTMWKYIRELDDHTLYTVEGPSMQVVIKVVMTNIDFSLGFCVNRQKLDRYFNSDTDYHSLLETSFGYTGVNIKMPCLSNRSRPMARHCMDTSTYTWTRDDTTLGEYLDSLDPAELQKETGKIRYNTFLVFHSGNVIMSGSVPSQMKGAYEKFLEIVGICRNNIEERLDQVAPARPAPVAPATGQVSVATS